MSPPTWRSLLIPTPPLTTSAPVVLDEDATVDVILVIAPIVVNPSTLRVLVILVAPSTFKLSLTDVIPDTESNIRGPVVVSMVLSSSSAILMLPNWRLPPRTVPATFKSPPI